MLNSESNGYDLVVIGGGAAGFFAAITLAECSSEARIVILEKGPEVLQKVRISGGGRCNVTHDCHDPREFVSHYPRGSRALPGPMHRWNAADMIDWLAAKGVELKTEKDGRMFPATDCSQTIIDCFLGAAKVLGIAVHCRWEVKDLDYNQSEEVFEIQGKESLTAKQVLIATGGVRTPSGAIFAAGFDHSVESAAPSLFTFKINDPRLEGLSGVSVPSGTASITKPAKFSESGPILITHWGLSGPGILKLSARAARELRDCNYQFEVAISWVDGPETSESMYTQLLAFKTETGKQNVCSNTKFDVPARLWRKLCEAAHIDADTKWGNISKADLKALAKQLTQCQFQVNGKSMNKDEFVTCGGVKLNEVDLKTMQSKLRPGLYFAGEVLDIDGVTGGFNFQSAWTTARIAGTAISENV